MDHITGIGNGSRVHVCCNSKGSALEQPLCVTANGCELGRDRSRIFLQKGLFVGKKAIYKLNSVLVCVARPVTNLFSTKCVSNPGYIYSLNNLWVDFQNVYVHDK